MINLLLTLLLVHYAYILIFKPKSTTLNCGLFGWGGKDTKDFNRDKFDKLGIFNEARGTHSCGIGVDGEIYIGVDGNKVYRDFIYCTYDNNPTEYPVVIGHTRLATYGLHTVANAHPFGFGTNKDGRFNFVGAHNGTLINHEGLAKQYNVDTESYNNNIKRTKIDSEILLEIISKSQNFKVLSQYNGAAALIFTDTNKPNVLYCYHGKSKKYSDDVKEVEERPLYFYQESKNSVYVSSMEDSLEAIGGDTDTIFEFEHNTVYEIVDGDAINAKKYKIRRSDNFQKKSHYGNYYSTSGGWSHKKNYNKNPFDDKKDKDVIKLPKNASMIKDMYNIHNENKSIDINKTKGRIYFNKLRYWRNGHLINGCYMWVPKYGFYFLDTDIKRAEKSFWHYVNKPFYEGDFVMTNEDNIPEKDLFIPFNHSEGNEIKEPFIHTFYQGIRVKTSRDYIACREQEKVNKPFSTDALSMCSYHPIIEMNSDASSEYQDIMHDGTVFTGTICPLGSNYIYTIEEGNCVHIDKLAKSKTKELLKLDELEKELLKEEDKSKSNVYNLSEDLLDKDIDEMFMKNFRDFPRYIKRLKIYEKNFDKAALAIEIMERYIKDSRALVTLEINE